MATTLRFSVDLTDRNAVIEHYKPPQGEEDAVCDEYVSIRREQIVLDLGETCPLITCNNNIISLIFPSEPNNELLQNIRDRMRLARINAITISEVGASEGKGL